MRRLNRSNEHDTFTSDTRQLSKVSWSMFLDSPRGSKKPVGATTPSSFSNDILREVEALPWEAGANAAALAMREAAMASFMVSGPA
jgi:hypothetical protein